MTDPFLVKIGEEYFPSEWFDFDREENIMKFDPETDTLPPSDYDSDHEGTLCPQCKSSQLEYRGEFYDDDFHLGSGYRCEECDARFTEQDIIDGLWE